MRAVAAALVLVATPALAAGVPTSRRFTVTHTFVVPAHATAWIPVPSDDPWQRVSGVSISGGASELVHDVRWGNAFYRVAPHNDPVELRVAYEVSRDERGAELSRATHKPSSNGLAPWLAADALVPINERVRKISAAVTGAARTPLDQARAAYAYVLSTMKYDKPDATKGKWGRGDILWACDMKYGNCTDFHALLIGILRAAGIPARFSIGYSVPAEPATGGELAGYHCWAELYLDGAGWVPVDASEGWKRAEKRDYFFGHHDANRVQLSTGRDLTLPGMRAATPLNFIVFPYAEGADGKPVEVARTSRWAPAP
jgi:transglutaminase-like putative cysteine protease